MDVEQLRDYFGKWSHSIERRTLAAKQTGTENGMVKRHGRMMQLIPPFGESWSRVVSHYLVRVASRDLGNYRQIDFAQSYPVAERGLRLHILTRHSSRHRSDAHSTG